ncbi:MAG: hypothetical protein AAF224_02935 [Pseudomonadota bacterium]
MQDIFLYGAGLLGIIISVAHGYIGEVRVVRPVRASTTQAKRVLHAIMFLSAVYWFAASALLLITPLLLSDAQRPFVVYGVALVFVSGCLGNLWATRGGHFGWILLAAAAALAIAGA